MSKRQDRSVHIQPQIAGDDGLSWQIGTNLSGNAFDGPFRAVRDGTHMYPSDRIGYALNLIDWDRYGHAISRSKKQLMRYASGQTDVPLGVLSEIATFSGLPVDWLAAGRASTEEERLAWLAGDTEHGSREPVPSAPNTLTAQVNQDLDTDALELVIESIEKLLQEENIQLTNRKKAEAVAEFYSRLVAEKRGNSSTLDVRGMQRLLRLLA